MKLLPWRMPTTLLGRPLPRHLRGWRLWLASGGRCLLAVAEFLEEERANGRLPSSADRFDDASGVDALIRACLEARDATEQDSVRGLLQQGLLASGVTEIDGTGERFDPEKHRAVTTAPTSNPHEDGVVARTLRRGYAFGGRMLRMPEVAVFTTRRP
jgi:hypothetical protein